MKGTPLNSRLGLRPVFCRAGWRKHDGMDVRGQDGASPDKSGERDRTLMQRPQSEPPNRMGDRRGHRNLARAIIYR